ncbi:ATP-dependent helicase, partial [Duganella callida]
PSPQGGYAPRRDKVDPWFLKPYEPSQNNSAAAKPAAPAAGASITKAKPKLAFLLGGVPKS